MVKKSKDLLMEMFDAHGAVYALRDDVNHRIKIGHSRDPILRIRNLQTGSAVPLRLVALLIGSRAAEVALHRAFEDSRLRGEWFDDADYSISDTMIELVRRWEGGK